MQRKYRIILTVLALVGIAPMLAACYTTRGAGQDLQAAGQGISNSAAHNTHYSP